LVERRGGPLEMGQADGVTCRTVETFEAFGLSEKLVREG
jgi:phenol 2-monooxygenase